MSDRIAQSIARLIEQGFEALYVDEFRKRLLAEIRLSKRIVL